MIQPAEMLPSNVPVATDADSSRDPRVIQKHCSNWQPCYTSGGPFDQKCPSPLSNENVYSGYYAHAQPQHNYHDTAFQRHTLRYELRGRKNDHESEVHIEKQAKYLYYRFRASDQYLRYRERQQKDSKGRSDQKWPDRLEMAFFQALVKWPPMGRRKLLHKDKQRGRNELIADYIEELTGECRGRKQVSSHIQVLKPFIAHDPYIMQWLSKDDLCDPQHILSRGGHDPSYHEARQFSETFGNTPQQTHGLIRSSLPSSWPSNLPRTRSLFEVLEPIDFQMFVQRHLGENNLERLHTYTSSSVSQSPRQPDIQLHERCDASQRDKHGCQCLDLDFPILAAMHRKQPIDCNVISAEASIAMPTTGFKGNDGTGVAGIELGILFLCRSLHVPASSQVFCLNTFYQDGYPVGDQSNKTDEVRLAQPEDSAGVVMQVKFGSTFWANKLAMLSNSLIMTADSANSSIERVAAHINAINATQIMIVRTEIGFERLSIIHWKFSLSKDVHGRAHWAKVNLSLEPPRRRSELDNRNTRHLGSVYKEGEGSAIPSSVSRNRFCGLTLVTPFQCDISTSSNATSATWTSSTWPNSADDSTNTAPHSAIDFTQETQFDFIDPNTDISSSYEPSLHFNTPDRPELAFDSTVSFAPNTAAQDFRQPMPGYTSHLGNYALQTQNYSLPIDYPIPWGPPHSIDDARSVAGPSNYFVLPTKASDAEA